MLDHFSLKTSNIFYNNTINLYFSLRKQWRKKIIFSCLLCYIKIPFSIYYAIVQNIDYNIIIFILHTKYVYNIEHCYISTSTKIHSKIILYHDILQNNVYVSRTIMAYIRNIFIPIKLV